MSCVVPGCKSGFGTQNKVQPGVVLHRVPKDPDKRKKWAASIQRPNWQPSNFSRVCSLHFDSSDYRRERSDSNIYRKTIPTLIRQRLKPDATPHLFPDRSSGFTKVEIFQTEPVIAQSSRGRKATKAVEQTEGLEPLEEDEVSDFESLLEKGNSLDFPSAWNVVIVMKEDKMVIYGAEFNDDGIPSFKFSLVINSGLGFNLFANETMVPMNAVRHITENGKIQSLRDIRNIIAFLNSYSRADCDATDVVKECIRKLSKLSKGVLNDDALSQKLEFIVEQLSLALMPASARTYSAKLLWQALTWMRTSAPLYKQLLSEESLTLPSQTSLARLEGASLTESGFSKATSSYLSDRKRCLSARERLVSLHIDKVHTVQRVENGGGSCLNDEEDRPSGALLSFWISSVCKSYSDLVCFLPVVTSDAKTLKTHFVKVIKELEKVGFKVLVVIADNHKMNVELFTELGGEMKIRIQHPVASHPLFLLFDPVNVMRKMFSNFQKKRIFAFPDFYEGSGFKRANFDHLIALFKAELEKPFKLAHKLDHRVLFPGPTEQKSVLLASSVFHESTVEGLKHYSEMGHPEFASTAEFIGILLRWWTLFDTETIDVLDLDAQDCPRDAITASNLVDNCSFLRGFADWLTEWQRHSDKDLGMPFDIFEAARNSCECLASIFEYLLGEVGVEYVLPVKLQNGIEGRFGPR